MSPASAEPSWYSPTWTDVTLPAESSKTVVGSPMDRPKPVGGPAAVVRVARIADRIARKELPCAAGVIVDIEADEPDARAESDSGGREQRELLPARRAPRRPLVDNHRVTAQRGQPRLHRGRASVEELAGLGVEGGQRSRRIGQGRARLREARWPRRQRGGTSWCRAAHQVQQVVEDLVRRPWRVGVAKVRLARLRAARLRRLACPARRYDVVHLPGRVRRPLGHVERPRGRPRRPRRSIPS
jgi:hypothetical protein